MTDPLEDLQLVRNSRELAVCQSVILPVMHYVSRSVLALAAG